MAQREVFVVGLKMIGIYCVVLAMEFGFHIIPGDFIRGEQYSHSAPVYRLLPWISLMIPLFLATLGRYLMLDGGYFHDLVFLRNDDGMMERMEGLFTWALALYGLFVLAGVVPLAVMIVSKVVVVLYAPSYIDTEIELDVIKSDLLPLLIKCGLGFMCLYKGRFLTRLAFHRSIKIASK